MTLIDFWKQNKPKAICISDDYILDNMQLFLLVDTRSDGVIPFRGLDYYGTTIIPNEEIAKFIEILRSLSCCNALESLINLSEEAIFQEADLLHIGI